MEKEKYERLKDIKRRMAASEKTTFAERNTVNMEVKKSVKKAMSTDCIIKFKT